VTGPDRASFLQGFLTNDIVALGAGQGCYAAWLTPQGRMLTDLHVFESGDMTLLDVPAALAEETAARLEQFHFAEDVQIQGLAESLRAVWVHGPLAPQILSSLAGRPFSEWSMYQNARVTIGGVQGVVARVDQLGVPGFVIYAGVEDETAATQLLAASGAVAASSATLHVARVEAGYPVFGIDMTTETIPLEAGIENRAISLTKGCYVGQEVIIRVLHRGHGRVAKRLVQLNVEENVPVSGAKILAADREVGFVTSSATSPVFGPLALGYVHRDFAEAGAAVEVETDAGRARATVRSRPAV
jgi:folate-binding protein YgfZ